MIEANQCLDLLSTMFDLTDTLTRENLTAVIIYGDFTVSLLTNTTPHVSFNVTSPLPNGRTGLIPGEDAFCHWVVIIQNGNDDDAYIKSHAQALCTRLRPSTPSQPSHWPFPSYLVHRQKRKDKLNCPPKKGKAQISSTILLLGVYVPEVNFTVKVKATEEGREGRIIFDLWTEFELRYKDGMRVK